MKRNRIRGPVFGDFGAFLRSKREQKNITQLMLANKLGYQSAQFVSNWERGVSRPPTNRIREIIKVLGIDRAEMINFLVKLDRNEWERQI